MKKFYTILSASAAILALLAVSCVKEQSAPAYQPAEKVEGTQYFFAVGTQTQFNLNPETTEIVLPVKRIVTTNASTVIISVKDTSKVIIAAETATFKADFAAGEDASSISIPIDYSKFEFGDKFGVDVEITEESTPYADSKLHLIVALPEPWNLLGQGYYSDSFTWAADYAATLEKGKYAVVNIYQNDIYKNQFKIEGAYDGYLDFYDGDADPNVGRTEEFVITILNQGDKPNPNGEEIPFDGCVYWPLFATEIYADGQDIYPLHPSSFTSRATADNYALSYVKSYQENGLPAIIELNPFWYVLTTDLGSVGGWGFGYPITIAFPGVAVNDYSVDISFEGIFSAADGDYAVVNVEFGEDLNEALIAIAAGEDPTDAFYLILDGDESVVSVSAPGEYKIPVPEEISDVYSIVIAPVADGEILADDATYDTFAYKDFSISVSPDAPEANSDLISGTVKAKVFFGKDAEYAKVALFEGDSVTDDDLAIFDTDSDDVIDVKYSGQEIALDLPVVGKYSIAAVSYAYDEARNVDVQTIDFITLPILYSENFDGELGDFSVFDADGDGFGWYHSNAFGENNTLAKHSGSGSILSFSWFNGDALNPDNWLFTPAISFTTDNYLSFWIAAQDPDWNAEHYGVYITDQSLDAIDLNACVKIFEQTIPEGSPVEEVTLASDVLFQRFVVAIPSEFDGKNARLAFRHFDCTDNYYLVLDDIMVTEGNPAPAPAGIVSFKSAKFSCAPYFTYDSRSGKKTSRLQAVSIASGRATPKAKPLSSLI